MNEMPVSADSYDAARYSDDENRSLIGNGFLGLRGALEEYRKEHSSCLAGRMETRAAEALLPREAANC